MTWDSLLPTLASNTLVAGALAGLAVLAGRMARGATLAHCLWVLCLLKLCTPPIVAIDVGALLPATAPAAPTQDPQPRVPSVPRERTPATAETTGTTLVRRHRVPTDGTARTAAGQRPLRSTDADRNPGPAAARVVPPPPRPETGNAAPAPWIDVQDLATCVWILGALAILGLSLGRAYRFHRELRHARPAAAGLQAELRQLASHFGTRRVPRLLEIDGQVSPLLWAFFGRARIVVPTTLLTRLSRDQRHALLTHELAHFHRRDHWVRILEILARSLHWWNPLVWWSCSRLRATEEECCDAWVLWALPHATKAYADALLDTVAFLSDSPRELPGAASGAGRITDLKRRLMMIMNESTPKTLGRFGRLAFLTVAAMALPLVPAVGQHAEKEQAREAAERARVEREAAMELDRRRAAQERSRRNERGRSSRRDRPSNPDDAAMQALRRAARLLRERDQVRDAEVLLELAERLQGEQRRDPVRRSGRQDLQNRMAELADVRARVVAVTAELDATKRNLDRTQGSRRGRGQAARVQELQVQIDRLSAHRAELQSHLEALEQQLAARRQDPRRASDEDRGRAGVERMERLEAQVERLTDAVEQLLRDRRDRRPRRRGGRQEEEVEAVEEVEEEVSEREAQEAARHAERARDRDRRSRRSRSREATREADRKKAEAARRRDPRRGR